MKKKKLIGILIALCLFICLSACLIASCGGGNDKITKSSSETEKQTTVSAKDKKDDSKTIESETKEEAAETSKDETNSNNSSSENTVSTQKSSGNSSSDSTQITSGNSSLQTKPGNSGSSSNPNSSSSSGSTGQPSHQHSYTLVSETAATCTSDGVRTYKCSGCGDSYTENGASALGHNWTDHYKTVHIDEQSHTETVKKQVCNGCGAQFNTADEAINHIAMDFWDNCDSYSYKVVDSYPVVDVPAHDEQVYDYTDCSRCGARQ